MCGILALLLSSKSEAELRQIAVEQRVFIRHRGPDWSGLFPLSFVKADKRSVLVHERLAIVGVDSGEQPIHNLTRTISLCVNGEIYNHRALKASLDAESGRAFPYQTSSDCEVVISLYERYFDDLPRMVRELDGMFSFILTDTERERVVISRDAMGKTSLYYGQLADGTLMVASEMKALEGVCETYDEFPPGFVYCSDWETPLQRWFDPEWRNEAVIPEGVTPDLSKLRSLFEAAVTKRLMCDVPYGVLLSGGLDSSLVAAIAADHAAKRVEDDGRSEAWFPRLHSFSIGLNGSPDLEKAAEVAEFLGTVHHGFEYTIEQGIDALKEVVYTLETYDVTTIRASTPMYLLSRRIKAMGVKMVLSGEGADEIFGGYLYFHKAPSGAAFHQETVRKVEALHLFDCLRANKSTMAWGVECRTPFLDDDFMEYAMTFDPAYKMIHNGATLPECEGDERRAMEKYILRRAFDTPEEPYLPADVLWRQKEQFSDGVGYGWIDSLRAWSAEHVSDEDMAGAAVRFPYNTPNTKEAYYYRTLFAERFPSRSAELTVPGGPSVACSTAAAIEWDASFKGNADPSGRAVAGVHSDFYKA